MDRTATLVALLTLLSGCGSSTDLADIGTHRSEQAERDRPEVSQRQSPETALKERYPSIPFNENVIHRVNAGTLNDDGWCRAKSTLGAFSVDVPGNFTDSVLKTENDRGVCQNSQF